MISQGTNEAGYDLWSLSVLCLLQKATSLSTTHILAAISRGSEPMAGTHSGIQYLRWCQEIRGYHMSHTPQCPQCSVHSKCPVWSSLWNHCLLNWDEGNWYAWCSDDCWAIDRAMTNDPSHGAVRDAGMQFTLDTECRIQTFDWCINGGLEIETLCLHSVLWR